MSRDPALLSSLFLFLAPFCGCITFNGKELPQARPTAPENPEAVVAVHVDEFERTHNGKHGDIGRMNEGSLGRNVVKQIARFWKQKGLIDDFGFPGELNAPATYRLSLSGTVDENSSLVAAFFTGLTLYLIPSSAHTTYDLTARLERLEGEQVTGTYEARAENSFTLWQWIVFLPVTPLGSVVWGTYGADRDRSLFLYQEFCKQGAFDSATCSTSH
jgi:hypothetical protein